MAVVLGAVAVIAFLSVFRWRLCDDPGSPCCGPDGVVNTKHCHKGLGCNITNSRCEVSGGPGQPCADGHFTGFSLKGYTGIVLDASERIDSCNQGARCDARFVPENNSWLGTRVCQGCGTKEGGSCCGADVRYGLGRCFDDVATRTRLTCNDPWARESGICIPCGRWGGEIACLSGEPCVDGLIEKNGICISCGGVEQPACDRGEPCRDSYAVLDRTQTKCLPAGGPNQPCLRTGGCRFGRMICNQQKICEICGEGGLTCCPPSQGAPCTVGECRDNRCFACGYMNMPVCPGNQPCRDGSEPISGFCRPCGGEGQRCCYGLSIRCDDGMRCKDGSCRRPDGGGGGGGGEKWKTCSGQPYTWSTFPRPVSIEDTDGCVITRTFVASTPEEALQCARSQHGEAVIDTPLQDFPFAVTCPQLGCDQRTFPGRDEDSAKKCAEATFKDCSVVDGPCP